jgi:hypothetical protein
MTVWSQLLLDVSIRSGLSMSGRGHFHSSRAYEDLLSFSFSGSKLVDATLSDDASLVDDGYATAEGFSAISSMRVPKMVRPSSTGFSDIL